MKKLSVINTVQSDNVVELTDAQFEETISKGITLVDFWAPWCTPCRIQNPVINQLADELKEKVRVCKINVDEHKQAAIKMKIKNIPNIIIFKDGVAKKQIIGAKPKHTIMKAVLDIME